MHYFWIQFHTSHLHFLLPCLRVYFHLHVAFLWSSECHSLYFQILYIREETVLNSDFFCSGGRNPNREAKDTSCRYIKCPVESIRAGGRYYFIVEHDVKELGAHTLVCTALYSDGDRKYLLQFFKFVVANPVSVKTKGTTFLEACTKNHTKSNPYMDQVDFEPAQHWSSTVLKLDDHYNPNTI